MAQGPECDAVGTDGGLSVACRTLGETAILAEVIADMLTTGDVILLDGALAAGKTTFVTQVCQALDCKDQPSSPTYAISNVYTCPDFEVFHIDAYRLGGVSEFYDLGIEEFFPDAVALIEWGERISDAFPEYLHTVITFQDPESEARLYTFGAKGARWQARIAELAQKVAEKGIGT